jgi:hypothetical protein
MSPHPSVIKNGAVPKSEAFTRLSEKLQALCFGIKYLKLAILHIVLKKMAPRSKEAASDHLTICGCFSITTPVCDLGSQTL